MCRGMGMGDPMACICGCSWGIIGEEQAPAPAWRLRLPVLLPGSFLAGIGQEKMINILLLHFFVLSLSLFWLTTMNS